jgi:hypothetical protein
MAGRGGQENGAVPEGDGAVAVLPDPAAGRVEDQGLRLKPVSSSMLLSPARRLA